MMDVTHPLIHWPSKQQLLLSAWQHLSIRHEVLLLLLLLLLLLPGCARPSSP
jgi:hypothetical protein